MYTMALVSSSSVMVGSPPRAGMEFLPLTALFSKPSKPCAARGVHAALSSTFGAPNTPAEWHEVQTALNTASPVRAALTMDLSTVVTAPTGARFACATASCMELSSSPLIEFFSMVLNKLDTKTRTAVPIKAMPPNSIGLAIGSLGVEC